MFLGSAIGLESRMLWKTRNGLSIHPLSVSVFLSTSWKGLCWHSVSFSMLSLSCSPGSVTLTPHWTPSGPSTLTPRPLKLSWPSTTYVNQAMSAHSSLYRSSPSNPFNRELSLGFKKWRAVPSGHSGGGEQRRFRTPGIESCRWDQPPERSAGRTQPQLEEPSAEEWWATETSGSCSSPGAWDIKDLQKAQKNIKWICMLFTKMTHKAGAFWRDSGVGSISSLSLPCVVSVSGGGFPWRAGGVSAVAQTHRESAVCC